MLASLCLAGRPTHRSLSTVQCRLLTLHAGCRCKLEDMYNAVATLDDKEQQVSTYPKSAAVMTGTLTWPSPLLCLVNCCLSCLRLQVLASILSAYSSKLLGEKGGNEASMSLRDSLCAAAAAHSYRHPQVRTAQLHLCYVPAMCMHQHVSASCCPVKTASQPAWRLLCVDVQSPEASKSSAATFRQQGLPACSTLEAGFTAGQLLRGGYSPAELVQSGAPLAKLRAAGIRCVLDVLACEQQPVFVQAWAQAHSAAVVPAILRSVANLYSHLPADEAVQLSGVAGAAALRAAGYPAAAVQEGAAAGAFSSWDLKLAGYPVTITSSSPAPPAAAGGSYLSPRSRFSLPAAVLKQQQSVQQPERSSQQDGLGPSDVQYFRHQIAQLVQMQPGMNVPPLLLCSSAKVGGWVEKGGRHVRAHAAMPLLTGVCALLQAPSPQSAAAAASPASTTARMSSSASSRVPRIKWQPAQLGAAEASAAAPHKHQQQQQQLEEPAAAEECGAAAVAAV